MLCIVDLICSGISRQEEALLYFLPYARQQIKTHFKIIHVSKILVTQKDLPIPFRCKQTPKINNNNNNSNDKNKKKR